MKQDIYSKTYKRIIDKLKNRRIELNITQKELADKLGYTQSFISKLEAGQSKLDIIEFIEIIKILKISSKEVLDF